MEKRELIKIFKENHQKLIQYVDNLDSEEFIYIYNNKWSAAQQLKHILLTLMPFPKILSSKAYMTEKFGTIDRPTWDYQKVFDNYLKTDRKSPEQFVPDTVILFDQKQEIISNIQHHVEIILILLNNYSEEELDSLSIPHPLLGKLTIREMFYLMSYHPLHHLKQVELSSENYRK